LFTYFCLYLIMKQIEILKGIHPGLVLERELAKRHLSKGQFALSINEYPQTLSAITKGKRNMNTSLALKIEHALGLDEGFFMILQVYYEIKEEKRKQLNIGKPDLSKIRTGLFWDTDVEKINWDQQRRAVIERIFERGNEVEKNEIIRFYGKDTVNEIINQS